MILFLASLNTIYSGINWNLKSDNDDSNGNDAFSRVNIVQRLRLRIAKDGICDKYFYVCSVHARVHIEF